MNGFADRDLIVGLVAVLVASYAAFFTWVVASINRLDRKIDTKFDALDSKFDTKIDALDHKFDSKIDALDHKFDIKIDALDTRLSARIDALGTKVDTLTVTVARLEGAVWGRIPPEAQQGRS
jgi:hypothetical protein